MPLTNPAVACNCILFVYYMTGHCLSVLHSSIFWRQVNYNFSGIMSILSFGFWCTYARSYWVYTLQWNCWIIGHMNAQLDEIILFLKIGCNIFLAAVFERYYLIHLFSIICCHLIPQFLPNGCKMWSWFVFSILLMRLNTL